MHPSFVTVVQDWPTATGRNLAAAYMDASASQLVQPYPNDMGEDQLYYLQSASEVAHWSAGRLNEALEE